PIPTGSDVWMEIPLLQGATVGLHGTVAHVVSVERARLDGHVAGVGICFERLEPTRRTLIHQPANALPAWGASVESRPPREEATMQTVLEAELGRLRELLPWQVLEISRDATLEQAAAAYRSLGTRYHPDTLGALVPPSLRHLASECSLAVQLAYEQFCRME